MHSVDQRDGGTLTLAGWLRKRFPNLAAASPNANDCGLVQRLDRETSGLLLAAKSRKIWSCLHDALCSGAMHKRYLVLCEGSLREALLLSGFIGQRYRGSKKMLWAEEERPGFAPAATRILPLQTQAVSGRAFLAVDVRHAARHQVRLSAATSGHALVGDALYGASSTLEASAPQFLLHAFSLRGAHPVQQSELDLCAPVPAYFSEYGWNVELLSRASTRGCD